MSLILLITAIAIGIVKVAATIWLVRQPDATTVTATSHARAIYYAGKVSPALFVAVFLAYGWINGAPTEYIVFCAIMLPVTIIMAVIIARRRAAGKWYGLAHDIKQRRLRRS
jgi:hypothetical protein